MVPKRAAAPTRVQSVASYSPAVETKPVSSEDSRAEGISNIKAIFPDLGEGFIEACIAAYKGNVEEVIDALLTDNLQPTLLVLDRSLQKMWRGKGGGSTAEAISLDAGKRDKKAVYKEVEDKEFKRLQKERLLKMEQQQEMDHMLLMREYNDDYDDQVIDTFLVCPFFTSTSPSSMGSFRSMTSTKPRTCCDPTLWVQRRTAASLRRHLPCRDPLPWPPPAQSCSIVASAAKARPLRSRPACPHLPLPLPRRVPRLSNGPLQRSTSRWRR